MADFSVRTLFLQSFYQLHMINHRYGQHTDTCKARLIGTL